jgi:hypothetical protein
VEVEVLGKHCHCYERRNQLSRASQGAHWGWQMPKFVRFRDVTTRRDTLINPEVVQLLEDATDRAGSKVRIIFGTGQSMLVEGELDDVVRKLSSPS